MIRCEGVESMKANLYSQSDDLAEVFVGRRIASVEFPVPDPKVSEDDDDEWWHLEGSGEWGLLTLDDGTQVYTVGHEGGCGCNAGCYNLQRLATTDNIITSVKVIDQSSGDEAYSFDSETDEYKDPEPGRYSIFVVTAAEELNVAEYEGTDGNGYYGTGFHLAVVPA